MRQATERGSGHEPGERQRYSGRYLSPSLSRTRKVQGSIADQVNRLSSHVCTFKATLSASHFPGTAHTPSYADVTQRVRRCVWAIAMLIGVLIGSMSQGQPPAAPSPGEKGPGTSITTAKSITEGTTVSGSLVRGQDRHFFQFKAASAKIRVIVRKRSQGGFSGAVDVYDHNESKVAGKSEMGVLLGPMDQPLTLSFESRPGALYYIVVTALGSNARSDYELTVRKE